MAVQDTWRGMKDVTGGADAVPATVAEAAKDWQGAGCGGKEAVAVAAGDLCCRLPVPFDEWR